MIALTEGQSIEVKGSAKKPYIVKMSGGVVSCSCPAWRNQSAAINMRTCKHIEANVSNGYNPTGIKKGVVDKPLDLTGALPDISGVKPEETSVKSDVEIPVMLAHEWDGDQDLSGWFISPKLDGVRALFDGEKFWSRNGKQFFAPAYFVEDAKKHFNAMKEKITGLKYTDGELWAGNGNFQKCVSIVRKFEPNSEEWKQITFQVFDFQTVPNLNNLIALSRYAYIEKVGATTFVKPVEHVQIPSNIYIEPLLNELMSKGYEGLMATNPTSVYEDGRSHNLLKIKKFQDAEARVLQHIPGKGKHSGKMGAILCELVTTKIQFEIGTGFTDKERENPPALGSTITFKYQELTKDGKPRFPVYMRPYEKL